MMTSRGSFLPRFCVIDHGHAILAEEVATSRILVAASILPNILCRSVDPQLADPYIIVDHHFQKKGIGSEVSRLMVRYGCILSFRRQVSFRCRVLGLMAHSHVGLYIMT